MTLNQVMAYLEDHFQVCEEMGMPTEYLDQHQKVVGHGPRDTELAPNGEPYITVTSCGTGSVTADQIVVMFADEEMAMGWFFDEVVSYATRVIEAAEETREAGTKPYLYWKIKPEFFKAPYLLMDQAGAMRTASPLAAVLQIELGWVQSQLLISTDGPAGQGA